MGPDATGPWERESYTRRQLLRLGALSGLVLLGRPLANAQEANAREAAPPGAGRSVIVLWLEGGPSQLETFDPHPGTRHGGPTTAIPTAVPGVLLASSLPRLAERLDRVALVRSLVSSEGEHERGTHTLRTGYAPAPTVQHPALGAVVAHELPDDGLELPRHVALLGRRPPRGGFLGAGYDAFAVGDPAAPLPDLVSPVPEARLERRLELLERLEGGFARGRETQVGAAGHRALAARARRMMRSPQLTAFRVDAEPASVRAAYGETPFGRGCLAARRLVEAGVPAVEVTLAGWDTHVGNFEPQARLADVLDRALSALLDDLAARDLLARTLVVCGGEFGRTPRINALEGRDHWTRGFSWLLAGCGIRPGAVVGATDPAGERDPADPVSPQDLFATLYAALGVDGRREFYTPAGRPVKLNEGAPVRGLLGPG